MRRAIRDFPADWEWATIGMVLLAPILVIFLIALVGAVHWAVISTVEAIVPNGGFSFIVGFYTGFLAAAVLLIHRSR